ncbi:MAG: ComF family protein [Planctomycetia bacterium]|nr:ComF family protein [Planctomycetia bacterium]
MAKLVIPHIRPLAKSREYFREWLGHSADLLFPPACVYCQHELASSAQGLLCQDCHASLVDDRPACARCGANALPDAASGRCFRCKDDRFYFGSVVRLGSYAGIMRTAVLRMKREDHRALAVAVGDLLAGTHAAGWEALKPDAVVPIPMHWSRRVWRGVNSPETISERLAHHLHIPLARHLLKRRRRTAPQASLPPTRRLANVRGAFRAVAHPDLKGARLLLVDDIMTTGATVNEAAKMLAQAGASFIGIAVVARAEGVT